MKKHFLLTFIFLLSIIFFQSCSDSEGNYGVNSDSSYYNSVVFDLVGGHINGNSNNKYVGAYNGRIIDAENFPKDPRKPGYTFDGWYTEKNGIGNKFTNSTRVYVSFTVYAHWIPN